jgi:uncharacterized SAM-binding protein YcdF (DUF218 family)
MLSAVATVLLVPPVNLAALALLLLLLGRRRLAAAALVLLLLLALPAVAGPLLVSLETGLTAPPGTPPPQAIVILGGDVRQIAGAPATEVGALSLARLRGGAALARATHLPILVTGGVVGDRDGPPVATVMAASLAADFATPARWVEPRAHDTWQNARFAAAMLHDAGIGSVYVVTDAWHMRRALIAFAGTGLAVTPAPLPRDRLRLRAGSFVPQAGAWRISYFALHEWLGCAWYELRRALG